MGSGAPIVLSTHSRACRCRQLCRPSWRRALTACHRKRSACSRLLPSLAWKCHYHCCRPSPRPPRKLLQRSLAQLQTAEFLYETRLFPAHEYTFRHALTHEVAYRSLLLEQRRVLHARIVEALEALTGDRVAEQVERLAHHAVRGEVWDKALTYYRQAGSKAAAHSAYREAVTCFEQALMALQHLPTSHNSLEQGIDLRFDLRNALHPLGEFGDIFLHMREAESLANALHDQRRLGQVSAYLANYFRLMGDHDRAIESGLRAHAIAIELRDAGFQIAVNYYVAAVYGARGDYGRAVDFLRQNMVLLTGNLKHERFGMLGLASVLSHGELAWSLAELGAFAEGLVHGEEGVRIAEAVDHPYSAAYACIDVSSLYLRKGELHKAIPLLERGLRLCQSVTLQTLLIMAASLLGSAYALSGRLGDALPLLEQAVEQATAVSMTGRHSRWMVNLSEGYLLAGRLDDAMQMALRALDLSRAHKELGNQAYALRLLGEIAARRDPPERELAESHYQPALTLAEELGMRPLQAHCHRGLGTLYAATNQREKSRTALSTAIALYRDMDMTFWLPQTEVALAQVT